MQQCQREEYEAQVMDNAPGARPNPAPDVEAERHQRHQIQADLSKPDPERLVAAAEREQNLWWRVANVAVAEQHQRVQQPKAQAKQAGLLVQIGGGWAARPQA